MNACRIGSPRGAILYDSTLFDSPSDAAFDAAAWTSAAPVTGRLRASGRGNTMIVAGTEGEFVLRHFVRGGLIGRFVRDGYLWTGEDRTRAFKEWRLLAELSRMGLPVPRPAAARYLRRGPVYRADLLTVRIPGVVSLSERIAVKDCGDEFWHRLGEAIATFHKAGVCHADLNAYNILIDDHDKLWLVDFDRGRLRAPGSWRQGNLDRLRRSLAKIKGLDPEVRFTDKDWLQLLAGYCASPGLA